MIGLDTNVLIRYITQDDKKQSAQATQWIEKHCTIEMPGWISSIVLCETAWVLSRAYGYDKATVIAVLQKLLATSELAVEHQEQAWAALNDFSGGKADFSDYLIAYINHNEGCKYTVTFDKQASAHRMFQLLE